MKSARVHRTRVLTVLLLFTGPFLFFIVPVQAQPDAVLPPFGGGGGGQFVARCPQGQLLTGFDLRVGDDIDAIRPICNIAYKPAEAGPLEPYPTKFGGNGGGGDVQLLCPRDYPIIAAIYIRSEGVRTISVNNIHLYCGVAATTQSLSQYPSARFDGPKAKPDEGLFGLDTDGVKADSVIQQCPVGLVAVGITGRSGIWLDALGLICGIPKLTPRPIDTGIRPQGRVKGDPGEGRREPLSICASARDARARNNPAAPGLEAKCRAAGAAGEIAPVRAQGRVRPDPGATPSSPKPICESARLARERNSPAAPGLEQKCRAELAATGAAIAQRDPIVAGARNLEPAALYRQGFDIATAIFGDPALGAIGNTATGPGSLGIRNALDATGQRGFNDSVKLHLGRDYRRVSGPGITVSGAVGTDPATVYLAGQTQRAVNVSWNASPDHTYCEIYISINNGQWSELGRGRDGTKAVTMNLGRSYTFRMMVYEGQAGTPRIIQTLTVNTAP